MSGKKQRAAATQLDMLDGFYAVPPAPRLVAGGLGCAAAVAGLVSAALDHARDMRGLSRAMVAARMSELTGEAISAQSLDAMAAPSHGMRFPLQWLAALVEATGSHDPASYIAQQLGGMLLVGKDALDAHLGQVRRQAAELKKREKALLAQMAGGRRHA
jgi:hypothetical protein